MRRLFRIILTVFLALVLFSVVGLSVVFLDVASYTATASETLNAPSIVIGRALVVYDQGITGAAKDVATKIAAAIQGEGYTVDLAGVRSAVATGDLSQYQVIVIGGPIYGGKAASSIQSYLSTLSPAGDSRIGVFGVGGYDTENDQLIPPDNNLLVTYALKINTDGDVAAQGSKLVTQLLYK